MRTSMKLRRAAAWLLLAVLLTGMRLDGAVVMWDGSCGDGHWHTCCPIGGGIFENNWDFGPGAACPLPLPGLLDDVDLGGADVLLDLTTVEINSLTSTGIFTRTGVHLNVTQGIVLNEFNCSGGTMSGGGPIVINGPLTAFGGEIRRLGNPGDPPIVAQFLGGITVPHFLGLDLSGLTALCTEDCVWQDGTFALNEGTTFDSQATFAVECDETMLNSAPAATFINNGTFVKRVTTGTTLIFERVGFESPGPVEIQTGTLRLENATGYASNTFTTAAGAQLQLAQFAAGTFTLNDGASFAGPGKVRSTSSALIIPQDVGVGANNFELAGGSLIGPGSLGVLFLEWNNGTVDGAQVEAISTLDLTGFLTKSIINGGLVENSGHGNWTGTGSLSINNATFHNGNVFTAHSDDEIVDLRCTVNNGGEFHNDTGATFTTTGRYVRFLGSGGTVRNDGTLTTTAETLEFEVPFINHGVVQSQSGAALIRIEGGGESTGTFETVGPFGGGLLFTGLPYTLKQGTEITGDGTLTLTNSELIVPSGTVPVECNYQQLSGTISGDGDLAINSTVGVSNWFNGAMRGGGTTFIGENTPFMITGVFGKTIDERELIIASTNTVFAGAGDIILQNGGYLNVLIGANFHVSGTDGPQDITTNSAIDGLVGISGSLEVNNLLRVDANTIFNMHGTANLSAELWLSGGGDFTDGLFAGTAALELRGGTYEFDDTFVYGPVMRVKGGTADVTTTADVDTTELSSGAIDGPGEFKSGQTLDWTGGSMKGAGKTTINGLASITGTNSKFIMQRTIDNSGSGIVWSDGTLTASQGAIINNHQPFEIAGSPSLQSPDGLGVINNHSTFYKSAGVGQTNIFIPFSHAGGEVRCDAGTLRFAGAFNQTGGVTRFGTGGNLIFSQSLLLIGGLARGSGAATANIVNIGGRIAPGDSAGDLSITGTFMQAAGGTLEIELAGPAQGISYDVVSFSGTATLGGTLELRLLGGFAPQIGDTFEILTAGAVVGEFENVVLAGFPPRLAVNVTYGGPSVVVEIAARDPEAATPGDEVTPGAASFIPPP